MAIVNFRQASANLGFRRAPTLRRLLQAGELSAYVRSRPDLRATYLDVAPKCRPTLRQHVRAHTACRGNSPLWGADYESWPKGSRMFNDATRLNVLNHNAMQSTRDDAAILSSALGVPVWDAFEESAERWGLKRGS